MKSRASLGPVARARSLRYASHCETASRDALSAPRRDGELASAWGRVLMLPGQADAECDADVVAAVAALTHHNSELGSEPELRSRLCGLGVVKPAPGRDADVAEQERGHPQQERADALGRVGQRVVAVLMS